MKFCSCRQIHHIYIQRLLKSDRSPQKEAEDGGRGSIVKCSRGDDPNRLLLIAWLIVSARTGWNDCLKVCDLAVRFMIYMTIFPLFPLGLNKRIDACPQSVFLCCLVLRVYSWVEAARLLVVTRAGLSK